MPVNIPNLNASAAFKTDSGKVFKEDVDIVSVIIDETLSYMPWGGDDEMPFNLLKLVKGDETLATCQMLNAKGTNIVPLSLKMQSSTPDFQGFSRLKSDKTDEYSEEKDILAESNPEKCTNFEPAES